jgi:hypothetical protein
MRNNSSGAENSQDDFAYWLSGFVDGEGCFSVSIYRNVTMKLGWQVFPEFTISQNACETSLLMRIRTYFGGGSVVLNKRYDNHHHHMCKYVVRNIDMITRVIIPFFKRNPLRTHKCDDFLKFCSIIELIVRKNHLTPKGLARIAMISAKMNTGRLKGPSETISQLSA